MGVLHVFCHHSNIILIHFYWFLLVGSVPRFLVYCLTFCRNQLFAGSGYGESRNRLLTVLYLFFCLLMLYFCVAPSQVFFEHVFGKSFNLYIRNFLIELHFVFIAFILLLIVLLCFWSYSGRYSFYTFCLMHSLKVFEQTKI